ncbi:MAG TPA: 2,4-dienoyl-CoA reductase, partial [Hyphomonadaceae bacterium]|nr:2,4-dienoyl-CoA reductase [Hyphomonadaceae bacterium]
RICPDLPNRWQAGEAPAPALKPIQMKDKALASAAQMSSVRFQMKKLSRGKRPNPNVWPLYALVTSELEAKSRAKQYRNWIARR